MPIKKGKPKGFGTPVNSEKTWEIEYNSSLLTDKYIGIG
jgi:hypothetical protein